MATMFSTTRVFHTKSSKAIKPLLSASAIPTSNGLKMSEFVTWTLQNEIYKRCQQAMQRKARKEQEGILASLASRLYCLCVRFFLIQLCDVLQQNRTGANRTAIVGYIHHFHHVLTEYDITEETQTAVNEICSRTLAVLTPHWEEFVKGLQEGERRVAASWEAFDSENPSEDIVQRVAPAHLSSAKEVDQQSINYRMAYSMMIGLETSIRVEEGVRLLSCCPYGVGEFNAELEQQIALLGFTFPFPLRLNELCPHEQSVEMATDVVNLVLSAISMRYTPPPAGSLVSPPHVLEHANAAAFEELAPALFSQIRRECGIESADYAWSVAHRGFKFVEFSTNSKSGETFFFSHDGRFIVKTISEREAEVLVRMLPGYMAHLRRGPSLLMRICGLYRVGFPRRRPPPPAAPPDWAGARFFIVALSVFDCGGLGLHSTFDLKGSTRGRKAKPGESVKKDRDWLQQEQTMQLPVGLKRKLNAAVEDDASFLAAQGVLDYSLLLALHDSEASHRGRLCRGVELVTKAVQRRLMPLIRTVLAFKPPDDDPDPEQPLSSAPRPADSPAAAAAPHALAAEQAPAEGAGAGREGEGEGEGSRRPRRLSPLPPPVKQKGEGQRGGRWGMGSVRGGQGGLGGMLMGATSMRLQWRAEMGGVAEGFGGFGGGSVQFRHHTTGSTALPVAEEEAEEQEEQEEAAEPAGRKGEEGEGWAGPHGPISGGLKAGLGERGRFVYFVGIVDFLIPWDGRKRMEFGVNILRGNRTDASCVPPGQYAQRQIEFISRHVLGMCTVNFAVQYGKRSEFSRLAPKKSGAA